jgi:hypothetical protein
MPEENDVCIWYRTTEQAVPSQEHWIRAATRMNHENEICE